MKDTAAGITRKVIPAEADAGTAAEADAALSRQLQGATSERPAGHITEVRLMMEPSLIHLMTAVNRWNLSAAQVR